MSIGFSIDTACLYSFVYSGKLLSGIHRLEDVEAGFSSSAFNGELFRVLGAVSSVQAEGEVVGSGG